MGKDRRKDKAEEDESLGKKGDKFGKKGDGKKDPQQGPEKSFSHQECRHILVQKQSEALRIRDEIHDGKISFNEAAFKYSEDKAGAHGLLGWKSQGELDQDFCKLALPSNRPSSVATHCSLTPLANLALPSLSAHQGRPHLLARRAIGCVSRSRRSVRLCASLAHATRAASSADCSDRQLCARRELQGAGTSSWCKDARR